MKNKELLIRRLNNLEGIIKSLRSSLNQNDIVKGREQVQKLLELKMEIDSIVERED